MLSLESDLAHPNHFLSCQDGFLLGINRVLSSYYTLSKFNIWLLLLLSIYFMAAFFYAQSFPIFGCVTAKEIWESGGAFTLDTFNCASGKVFHK